MRTPSASSGPVQRSLLTVVTMRASPVGQDSRSRMLSDRRVLWAMGEFA